MSIDRILVIRFSSLGDIILLTPLFREIKKRFPNAVLDFLTSTTFSSVVDNNPHIDSVICLRREKGAKEFNRIAQYVRSRQYDCVLDAHRSLRSRLMLIKYAGPLYFINRRVIQIDKRSWKRNLLLLTKINLLERSDSQREEYCKLLTPITNDVAFNTKTELFPSVESKAKISSILKETRLREKPIVAIGPGASFQGKCWPKEYFLKLINQLQNENIPVVIVGGKEEVEAKWIYERCETKPVDLSGKLTYLETAELLRCCDLTISNDSAVVHFSEAMNTPAIAIFGPTTREFGYGPFLENSQIIDVPLKCRPCSRNGRGNCANAIQRQCLTDVLPERVFNRGREILLR